MRIFLYAPLVYWLALSVCLISPGLACLFVQCSDGKRLVHPIPRFPADTPARIEIDTDRQIHPALRGPDIPDIRTPFLIRSFTGEVLIAHLGSDKRAMLLSVVRLQRVFCRTLRTTCTHITPVLSGDDLPALPASFSGDMQARVAICLARPRKLHRLVFRTKKAVAFFGRSPSWRRSAISLRPRARPRRMSS